MTWREVLPRTQVTGHNVQTIFTIFCTFMTWTSGQAFQEVLPVEMPTPKAHLPDDLEHRPTHLSPFIASRCFNFYGQVQVQLHCPFGHGIRTLIAFTAISRYDDCAYEPWDCIVQPMLSHRCEGRTTCFISDKLEGETVATWGPLVCGEGTTPYLHIEYECALLTDFLLESSSETANTSKPSDSLNSLTRMVIEKQNEFDKNDLTTGSPFLVIKSPDSSTEGKDLTELSDMMTSAGNAKAPEEARQTTFFDNKLIFSSIIGGSIVGATIVIALLAMLIKRIKEKTYEDSSFYGPPRHRQNSHSSSDISYMLREYPLRSRDFLAYLQSQRNMRAQQLGRGEPTSSYT